MRERGTTEADGSLVLPLDAGEATLELVGGKGASLASMARAGLPVPTGFLLTTAAYRRFVTEHDLQAAIVETASEVDGSDPAALERAASTIRGLFERGELPAEVAAAIRRAYAGLGEGEPAVAVRSSATAEDLPGLSFAGQQESFLNVRGEAALLDAARRCWASLWTARAIGYRRQMGVDHRASRWAWSSRRWCRRRSQGCCSRPTRRPASGPSW
jgi:rifampicin phosphotransferase